MCVNERRWMEAEEFEDAIAATNLLPGPASTQLAIFCAWRLRGVMGGIVGGVCFILPGLAIILAFSALFLAHHPAHWVLGAAAGAGAAVPAVALHAAWQLVPSSRERADGLAQQSFAGRSTPPWEAWAPPRSARTSSSFSSGLAWLRSRFDVVANEQQKVREGRSSRSPRSTPERWAASAPWRGLP